MKVVLVACILSLLHLQQCRALGILYPKSNPVREIQSLDGLWKFALVDADPEEEGTEDYINLMAVPSSYNDISTDRKVRDHVGVVIYERNFFVPESWQGRIIWLRFGSVTYSADVTINGDTALEHEIGHTAFVGDVTKYLKFGANNHISVEVYNVLTEVTIPQGVLVKLESGRVKQNHSFDYFNYAGIDRPVLLYTTPQTYIDDITLRTTIDGTTGIINYQVVVKGNATYTSKVTILDEDGRDIATNEKTLNGSIVIPNVNLWWPYLMDPYPGYQYTFRVELFDESTALLDTYDQLFGVRELSWDNTSFTINGKSIYMRGFGRHEDADIHGKGLDLAMALRDYSLIQWIGANSYRTSHYPYAEEVMDLADSLGILIIDEPPADHTDLFSDQLLENHKRSITELINRDKNRPSVVMWSAANEPQAQKEEASDYFKEIIAHVKSLDKTRPVTVANVNEAENDYSGQYIDIISMNIYTGWLQHDGDLDVIEAKAVDVAETWHKTHNKPVIVTEYGADSLEGYHMLPSFVWSEEYQNQFMSSYFRAFERLRQEEWFLGEMIWNFADFKTPESISLFSYRQPKSSAFLMRKRYWGLANELDNVSLPEDLENFVIGKPTRVRHEL
ncbi:hypothetical protein NQ315_001467 [Exocentrus adspersus]|uniref:Beta-glucuronidase n=1 Tax=Exocentrus adspersus TaxID=1586481 RepID=A0AAV8W8U5_9CUCU|nr:hypothetical protein NQ315_001467 [Exocentrus adspersus]